MGLWWEPNHPDYGLVAGPPEEGEWIEAPYVYHRHGFYYLSANWGDCCRGVASIYTIVVGRSRQPTGPYVDRDGIDLREGGGSVFLGTSGAQIGPGHAGIFRYTDANGTSNEIVTYHFYDRSRAGASWVAARRLTWLEGWPTLEAEDFDLNAYWQSRP